MAQDDQVLATVNGAPITMADVALAYTTLGETLDRVPEGQRDEMVLNLLIDMEILATAAEEQGFEDDADFKARMKYLRTQALREAYMEKVIGEAITDDAVRARYDEEVAKIEPEEEVSASHILVEDEETAKRIIEELDAGGDFAALAEEYSTDPGSKSRGGSLGFFGKGQMVPAFEEAAFALEPGEMTQEPVQSRFGYHIIKVDEKRPVEVPSFEQVSEQIQQVLVREAYVEELDRLKQDATIERPDQAAATGTDDTTDTQESQQ
ncbi:peptidylprolyl isomerase [Acuticoccus sp. M5D2P5]|uniref:peptidylprolyl isomerase n=1 Tax=Acuticoccus kalidii TaxID=2910977 RepID=UPI001F2B0DC7|nr:peptidylprolyl isomerase [Acuticoccus kalidii]MCF3934288.1 peptidylprolyl isomerase [Acuticoccus kalidii]